MMTKEEKTKQILDNIMDKLPDAFNMADIHGRAEDKAPYVIVHKCKRMNTLTVEMRWSLKELELGLKVSGLATGEFCACAFLRKIYDPH